MWLMKFAGLLVCFHFCNDLQMSPCKFTALAAIQVAQNNTNLRPAPITLGPLTLEQSQNGTILVKIADFPTTKPVPANATINSTATVTLVNVDKSRSLQPCPLGNDKKNVPITSKNSSAGVPSPAVEKTCPNKNPIAPKPGTFTVKSGLDCKGCETPSQPNKRVPCAEKGTAAAPPVCAAKTPASAPAGVVAKTAAGGPGTCPAKTPAAAPASGAAKTPAGGPGTCAAKATAGTPASCEAKGSACFPKREDSNSTGSQETESKCAVKRGEYKADGPDTPCSVKKGEPSTQKSSKPTALAVRSKEQDECIISEVEYDMIMANCSTCSARANNGTGGVILTCYDCKHIPIDMSCHYSKYDSKLKVSASFFDFADVPQNKSTSAGKSDKKKELKKK